jgi:uncharacterized protein (DUF2252 family)
MNTQRFTPAKRQAVLSERRNLKMARSAHAYVRGNTAKFYEWLQTPDGKQIPEGPPVWICGDCHVGNLGPVANVKGNVEIAIRDLDQTVVGNPAHDLIRLGLSLATAARGSDLPGVTTAVVLEEMIEGYQEALLNREDHYKDFDDIPKPVRRILKQAYKREWRHLAEERIENVKPSIPLGECFWKPSSEENRAIKTLFGTTEVRKLITSLRERDDDAKIEVADAAYWMKGCSSLGRLRYAVLLRIEEKRSKENELCIVDIKEATKATAPRASRGRMPTNNAKRVVEGASKLSPFLGNRMLAASFMGRDVFLRELMPQDLKLELDRLSREQAVSAARYLASVVGKAHGRQMDPTTRKSWREELDRQRSKTLDAPSWLWTNVVDLVASHEAAYLAHCRAFATANRRRSR